LEQAAANNNKDIILFRALSSGIIKLQSSSAQHLRGLKSKSVLHFKLSSIASKEL
jgi:hypothetical protein